MVEGGYGEFLLIKHYEYYDKYSGEFVRNMEGITAFHEWTEEEFPYETYFSERRETRTLAWVYANSEK